MELLERIKSKTPPFLKKVRNAALLVASVTGSILVSGVQLSEDINDILVMVVAVSTAIAGTAQTAKADKK